ncbi:alpha/beta hydrolase [Leucobacter luti]|uniref:Alpha-beta hydrolase superfamily lysophospholipase n=1 Tax=Leucobacter luti TaxID=340320 RepID=A0A4Q7U192_9MICO|nr:alpha/beta hydrolase [Leucobacter luti]MBL3699512.1 alpha/beta hydrolase [Leucobacter luti]RZT67023.1 alpha-beta hydrolase superfamily lysophospholipase [Leucobacter luti]
MTEWRADVLGDGFSCTDLELGSDEEGPLTATLVRSLPQRPPLFERLLGRRRPLDGVDVLYVHGWSDYFFQRHLAEFWTSRGARFFALDLRKYGRSLRPGQTPGYIEHLDDYDLELGLAHDVIRAEAGADPTRKLVLLGHSTGGLVLSLWAARHPGRADALILNSPWLEFQLSAAGRQVIAPLVALSARFMPKDVAPQLDYGFYTRAQREVGPQDELAVIDPQWRPERSHGVSTAWLRAILAGHERVNHGLGLTIPVAVLLSERSAVPLRWSDDLVRADTVLDVEAVARAALRLGSSVTIERIPGGLHDLFLSAPGPRAEAYARLHRWLIGWRAETAMEPPLSAAPEGAGRDRLGS